MEVLFQRPERIRLVGTDANADEFSIVSDGLAAELWTSAPGISGARNAIREALAEPGGISLQATVVLPGILLGIEWERESLFLPRGRFLAAFATKAELAGEETIGPYPCYRLVCSQDIGTWTFHVDKETFLIRRLDLEVSEAQMRAQREHGGGGFSQDIVSWKISQEFLIEEDGAELEEQVFTRP